MNTDYINAQIGLQKIADKARDRYERERDAKQRLRLYKKRYAKHLQKHRYNEKNGLETHERTLKAIQNNKQWIEHYENELAEVKREIDGR